MNTNGYFSFSRLGLVMKRDLMENWKVNLFWFLGIFIAFLAVYILMMLFNTTCIIKFIFGIPCPGCGLTRAWISVFRLDFSSAFEFHPLFWAVPIVFYYIIYDLEPTKSKILNYGVPILLVCGFFVVWLIRLAACSL